MTARIFTVAQHKGGAGKTTLAAHLAASWVGDGKAVAMVDIDPQGSLSDWYRRRIEALSDRVERLHLSPTTGWRVYAEVEKLALDYDVVVIDSPPHAETDARVAIRLASLVIVPVQPSPLDLWATRPTVDLARQEKVPVQIVLNRVPARARLTDEMVGEIAKLGPIARTRIGNRTAFAATLAAGVSVTDAPFADEPWCVMAAEEITALSREILRKPVIARLSSVVAA